MAVVLAAGFVVFADDSSASESFSLVPAGDDYVQVGKQLKYTLTYSIDVDMSVTAELLDSDGNPAGSVNPATDTLKKNSTTKTFTATAPSASGEYTLKLTITKTATEEGKEDEIFERYAFLKAVEPITLSVTVENTGDTDRSFNAYFYIQDGEDWVKLEDSMKPVKVSAGASQTVTYDYIVRDVKDTTFCLQAEDPSLGGEIVGLGPEHAHTFYTEANDYKVIEYVCIAVLVVLVILAVWIGRKPIKNRGKPKARR